MARNALAPLECGDLAPVTREHEAPVMRTSFRKASSLLALITFVAMGIGAQSFTAKWLAHDLDHAHHAPLTGVDHDQTQLGSQDSPGTKAFSDADHELMHAMGHFQLALGSVFHGLGDPPTGIFLLVPKVSALPAAEPDALFRPPRSIALI